MTATYFAPLLYVLISAASLLLGRAVLCLLRLDMADAPRRTLFQLAIGYMIVAYLVAGIGLAGKLSLVNVVGLLAAGIALGLPFGRRITRDLRQALRRVKVALSGPSQAAPLVGLAATVGLVFSAAIYGSGMASTAALLVAGVCLLALAALIVYRPGTGLAWLLLAWCLITFLAALAPPTDSDWDGLAEHLAQAKIYATEGRYEPLWYDHHSQFPALVQMLFTVGMLLQGPALAKLFHWGFAMLSLGAVYVIGERFCRRGSGKWSALVLATTPTMGWLAQIGYVDLGTTAYGLLAVLAFLDWRQTGGRRKAALSGVMCGAMMATKMQGIPLFGLLVFAALLIWRRRRAARPWGLSTVVALGLTGAVLASPWYLKTWCLTGNPVYPFAYGVFGGKDWGPQEAASYDYDQKQFGVDHLPPPEEYSKLPRLQRLFAGPRSPKNLLLAPVNLTVNPVPFAAQWRNGAAALVPTLLMSWIGPTYLVGLMALAVIWLARRRGRSSEAPGRPSSPVPTAVSILLWLFLPLWIWWLMSMQLDRYLLPSLALLAPVVGWVCCQGEGTWLRGIPALWAAVALGLVTCVAVPCLLYTTGMVDREQYLSSLCEVYEPSLQLNRLVPTGGKAILYGEPRGFYLDCPYMWGDPGHHRLIPYERLTTPQALVAHLRGLGFTHVLLNQMQAGALSPDTPPPVGLLAKAAQECLIRVIPVESARRSQYVILDLAP